MVVVSLSLGVIYGGLYIKYFKYLYIYSFSLIDVRDMKLLPFNLECPDSCNAKILNMQLKSLNYAKSAIKNFFIRKF